MDRRAFLTRTGLVAGVAATSGCTTHALEKAERKPPLFEGVDKADLDLPVTQRLGIAGAAVERVARVSVPDLAAFEAALERHGVAVERLSETEVAGSPVVSLEHAVDEAADGGFVERLGVVAGGYAALVAAADPGERLSVSVAAPDGEQFGAYEVRRRWADAYDEGTYSARKYAHEVVVTAKSA